MLPKSIFNTALAEEKVVEVVDAFASKYYIRSDAVQGVQLMCDEVRDALKQLQYSRYRFVVSGYIAEKDAQDVKIASRALIDDLGQGWPDGTFH